MPAMPVAHDMASRAWSFLVSILAHILVYFWLPFISLYYEAITVRGERDDKRFSLGDAFIFEKTCSHFIFMDIRKADIDARR